jgi:hypothetical protein
MFYNSKRLFSISKISVSDNIELSFIQPNYIYSVPSAHTYMHIHCILETNRTAFIENTFVESHALINTLYIHIQTNSILISKNQMHMGRKDQFTEQQLIGK